MLSQSTKLLWEKCLCQQNWSSLGRNDKQCENEYELFVSVPKHIVCKHFWSCWIVYLMGVVDPTAEVSAPLISTSMSALKLVGCSFVGFKMVPIASPPGSQYFGLDLVS